MSVWLKGGEGDLVTILGRVHQVFQTKIELGSGDFLAAFLFVGGGELFADCGELHLGFLDGLNEFATAFGFFGKHLLEILRLNAVILRLVFQRDVFFGSGFDALGEIRYLCLAPDGDLAELGEAGFHRALLLLGGLFRAFFDGEAGAEFVERGADFLLGRNGGIGLRLERAGLVFDGGEAFAGGGELRFEGLAGIAGGRFALLEFGALPADVFDAGVEILDLAGGERELALEGGELDFLALEALTGDLDSFALGFELGLERGDAGAGLLVGGAEGGDFLFERADFVLPF